MPKAKTIETEYLGLVRLYSEKGQNLMECNECGESFTDLSIIHIIHANDAEEGGWIAVHDKCKKVAEKTRAEYDDEWYEAEEDDCEDDD